MGLRLDARAARARRLRHADRGAGRLGRDPGPSERTSPSAARATIPAFVYQAGNFLASYNAPLQAKIAEGNGGDYGLALAVVAAAVAIAIVVVIWFSPERRGHVLTAH